MTQSAKKSNTLGKFTQAVFKALEIVISVALLLMLLLTFFNVLIRYSNFIPGWSEMSVGKILVRLTGVNAEIARISFIYLVYLGSIIAARDNKHLMIDTLMMKLPAAAQKLLYVVIQLIVIFLMGFLAIGAWNIAKSNINDFWVATHFPVFMIHFAGVLLGGSFILISIINLIRLFVFREPVLKLFLGDAEGDEREGVNPE